MMLGDFRLDGEVAVITGGTKGLGRAIAIGLAEAGADVAAVSRQGDPTLAAEIQTFGRRYFHLSADLTNRSETVKVIPAVVAQMGDVSILVNNSGMIRRSPAVDYSEADWDAILEIDLSAAFILSQAAGRAMLRKRKGKIINVCSVLAFQGGINVVAYTAAKHGLAGLTKALANEWAAQGINVNGLAPSYFTTELTRALQQDTQRSKSITSRTPAGRWGSPRDLVGAAVFLASSASDYIHGVILPVDGGWLAW